MRTAKVPPLLDVHAHVDPTISVAAVRQLGAYVFAMTRSLDEFDVVQDRDDPRLVWGVGLHPRKVEAMESYTQDRFAAAIGRSPLVGEIGLDANSPVPMRKQVDTLRSMFEVLQDTPRLVSVHSAGAHLHMLRALHRTPIDGVILHWWTGSPDLTDEAVRLDCSFSLPPALIRADAVLDRIPRDRLLPETDHPDGDRHGSTPRRPGRSADVERWLAGRLQRTSIQTRLMFWENLRNLAQHLRIDDAFPTDWNDIFDSPSLAQPGS